MVLVVSDATDIGNFYRTETIVVIIRVADFFASRAGKGFFEAQALS